MSVLCGCWSSKKLPNDLINFLRQEIPENQTPNTIIVTADPQKLRDRYNINKKILLQQRIYTIDQLANNQNVQRMIMSELEVEQFSLAYQYRNSQKNQFSQFPYGNSGYTFRFELQDGLSNGRNVLVIGERGSGKSTLINALGNSLIIDYADRYRYHICEYDVNDYIQECDLHVENVKFKFLEVLGYGQDLQQNQNIMLKTYEYLQTNKIQIDCIIICRRFGNQSLNTKEKQIICHLAEVFGQQYIRKCFLVNTNYDLGIETQIRNSLQESLNRINNIYDQMPDPKILFVNSLIAPFEGNAGALRFQTVRRATDAITQLIDPNTQKIAIINPEAFNHRRQIENTMRQIKNQIKTSLVELLPCLENYFSICEVNMDEDLFYANTVFWSNLEKEERIRQTKELSLILDDIILPDQTLTMIQQEISQLLTSLTIDIERQNRRLKEATYKEQFRFLRGKLTDEKTNRLRTIIQLADDYINEQQHFLQQTYLHIEETKQQLITNNMNGQLKLYLQQDQGLEKEELQREFEEIRQSLFLPNMNFFATQIIAI